METFLEHLREVCRPAPTAQGHGSLRNRIIHASSLLEVLLSGLVLIGLVFSMIPLIRWMPGLLISGDDVEIRIFLERSLDIVIGIEFIKMLAKHSPGNCLEVLLYAIARHLVVGHDSAIENLLSVGAIALIFIVRKFLFVPSFGTHLPSGQPAPDLLPHKDSVAATPPPAAQPETAVPVPCSAPVQALPLAEEYEEEEAGGEEEEEEEEEEVGELAIHS